MSGTQIGSPATDLAPALLDELAEALGLFEARTRQRGERYFRERRVGQVTTGPDTIRARVLGGEVYLSSWDWDGRAWEPDCTCPVGAYCKHAYALACAVLGEARLAGALGGSRPVSEDEPAAARPARPVRGVERRAASQQSALEELRAARGAWQREGALDQLLVGCPVATLNPYAPPLVDLLREPDPDILCWRLAKEIGALCDGWLPRGLEHYLERPDIAARHAERARIVVLKELSAWGESRRRGTARRVRLVFTIEPEATGAAVLTFEVRARGPRLDDQPRNVVQLQQMLAEFRRSPATYPVEHGILLEWVVDNCVAVPGSYGHAPRFTSSRLESLLELVRPLNLPPCAPFDFAQDAPMGVAAGVNPAAPEFAPYAAEAAPMGLATWSDEIEAGLARRGGVSAGEPVRFRRDAARLLPMCVSRDGEPWIQLEFVWADGRRLPFGEALLVTGKNLWGAGGRDLVLAKGELSVLHEKPPSSLLEQLRDLGGFVLPASERAELLAGLTADFPHLESVVRSHTRLHRTRMTIALDLREDDWLQVRLFGVAGAEVGAAPGNDAGEAERVFEHGPGVGWVRTEHADTPSALHHAALVEAGDGARAAGAAPMGSPSGSSPVPPSAEVWLEAPDPDCVREAVAWLGSLPLHDGTKRGPGGHRPAHADRTRGWWMRANARRLELLAAAWERRPADVSFVGSERMRRLLSAPRGVRPRLAITGSGADWFSVSAEWEAEGKKLSEQDLARLRAATTRFVRLESGWVRADEGKDQDEVRALLADLGVDSENEEDQRLTLWQIAGASPETFRRLEELGADVETLAAARALAERVAAFEGLPSVPVPRAVHGEMRPYQVRGLDFLAYTTGLGLGAVLADDMGLGKTLQALAWLCHLKGQGTLGGPCLVVCPASVVHNWAREAEHFTPELRVLLLTSGDMRHELRRDAGQYDIVVTNYALLRRDVEAWREIELGAVILDEAQFIKNPDAAVSRAARALRARHRLALTGTPLENRPLDLWSIASFVNPGYLGTRARFQERFDRADAPAHVRALLAARLRPILLRRTKEAVAPELPPRIEERYDCELGREQRQLYLAELSRTRSMLEKASSGRGEARQNSVTVLAALTRLRQICCHPALGGGKASIGSGKFDALFELLEPLIAEGHKVLLFSQFVRCLKLLAAEMSARQIRHHLLTGQTTKREQVVAAFQGDPDPCVFLVSLKAGGTGLNLTAASYVVLFDPWWNPAVEAQAIDRTHRIGQDRTVIAYRMLTRGTIEEKIWDMQQRKAGMAREILGEGGFARSLTREDLNFLFADE